MLCREFSKKEINYTLFNQFVSCRARYVHERGESGEEIRQLNNQLTKLEHQMKELLTEKVELSRKLNETTDRMGSLEVNSRRIDYEKQDFETRLETFNRFSNICFSWRIRSLFVLL